MGEALLKQVVESTGLPENLVSEEIQALRQKAGISEQDMTLENLRKIVASYLQDVWVEKQKEFVRD